MKARWLAILACLLVVACTNTETPEAGSSGGAGSGDKMGEKAGGAESMTAPAEDAEKPDEAAEPAAQEPAEKPAEQEPAEKPADDQSQADKPTDEPVEKEVTRADQFKEFQATFAEKMNEVRQAVNQASPAERQKLIDEFSETVATLGAQAMDLATAEPSDETAFAAASWVMSNVRDEALAGRALELIKEHHMDSEALGTICSTLARSQPTEATEEFIKAVIENSSHDKVKAAASMALAGFITQMQQMKEFAESNPDAGIPEYAKTYDVEGANLEGLYETIVENYGDLDAGRGKTYKDIAGAALFEIKYLSIGKVAPDIEGEDLDGEAFKLSDYRGKVVVLDFWGDW